MAFANSSNVTVAGGNFTELHGNLYNTTNIYFLGDGGVSITTIPPSESSLTAASSIRLSQLKQECAEFVGEGSVHAGSRNPNQYYSAEVDRMPTARSDAFVGPALKVGNASQITFLLDVKRLYSTKGSLQGVKTSRIAWQVFHVSAFGATLRIPSPRIGFGTVAFSEDGQSIVSPQFLVGPAGSLVHLRYKHGLFWSGSSTIESYNQIRAGNLLGFPTRLAIGSYHQNPGETLPMFQPFAITEEINHGTIVNLDLDFALTACKTEGIQAGQVIDDDVFMKWDVLITVPTFRPTSKKEFIWEARVEEGVLRACDL